VLGSECSGSQDLFKPIPDDALHICGSLGLWGRRSVVSTLAGSPLFDGMWRNIPGAAVRKYTKYYTKYMAIMIDLKYKSKKNLSKEGYQTSFNIPIANKKHPLSI
jgi:hypothetical protein